MQRANNRWLDILTAVWAIALILVATTWMAAPAFAYDETLDCGQCCAAACRNDGGCATSGGDEGGCDGTCMNGETWSVFKPGGGIEG